MAEKKAVTVNKVAEKTVAEVKKAVPEKKAVVTKKPVASKKTETKKTLPAKKTEKASAAKKAVFLEYKGGKYAIAELMDKAVKDFSKNNKEELKAINLYIKPEDGKVYYTANDGITGAIDL